MSAYKAFIDGNPSDANNSRDIWLAACRAMANKVCRHCYDGIVIDTHSRTHYVAHGYLHCCAGPIRREIEAVEKEEASNHD